jgi:hypothetical protein
MIPQANDFSGLPSELFSIPPGFCVIWITEPISPCLSFGIRVKEK